MLPQIRLVLPCLFISVILHSERAITFVVTTPDPIVVYCLVEILPTTTNCGNACSAVQIVRGCLLILSFAPYRTHHLVPWIRSWITTKNSTSMRQLYRQWQYLVWLAYNTFYVSMSPSSYLPSSVVGMFLPLVWWLSCSPLPVAKHQYFGNISFFESSGSLWHNVFITFGLYLSLLLLMYVTSMSSETLNAEFFCLHKNNAPSEISKEILMNYSREYLWHF